MARYKIFIGERVKGKIENLRDFYAEQKSGRDTDFLSNLWDCIEDLEENPFRWQYLHTKNEGTRRAILSNPQTIVYYKVIGDEVFITNVLDSREKRD